jgi:hypothetical protein
MSCYFLGFSNNWVVYFEKICIFPTIFLHQKQLVKHLPYLIGISHQVMSFG